MKISEILLILHLMPDENSPASTFLYNPQTKP